MRREVTHLIQPRKMEEMSTFSDEIIGQVDGCLTPFWVGLCGSGTSCLN